MLRLQKTPASRKPITQNRNIVRPPAQNPYFASAPPFPVASAPPTDSLRVNTQLESLQRANADYKRGLGEFSKRCHQQLCELAEKDLVIAQLACENKQLRDAIVTMTSNFAALRYQKESLEALVTYLRRPNHGDESSGEDEVAGMDNDSDSYSDIIGP